MLHHQHFAILGSLDCASGTVLHGGLNLEADWPVDGHTAAATKEAHICCVVVCALKTECITTAQDTEAGRVLYAIVEVHRASHRFVVSVKGLHLEFHCFVGVKDELWHDNFNAEHRQHIFGDVE